MSRKLIVSQYVSLDGVIEDPVGMEGTGLGDWTGPFSRGPEGDKFKHEELFGCDALLLGRITYDGFAAVWPAVRDDTGFAERINAMPKYVASRTLEHPGWTNTKVLPNAVGAVRDLKRASGGDILSYGSADLVHQLLHADLVDILNLMLYPVTLGRGKRLFPGGLSSRFELVDQRTFGSGVALLQFQRDANV